MPDEDVEEDEIESKRRGNKGIEYDDDHNDFDPKKDEVRWAPGRCVKCGLAKHAHPNDVFCTLPRKIRAQMRRSMLQWRRTESCTPGT
jgi:hypothetical protein